MSTKTYPRVTVNVEGCIIRKKHANVRHASIVNLHLDPDPCQVPKLGKINVVIHANTTGGHGLCAHYQSTGRSDASHSAPAGCTTPPATSNAITTRTTYHVQAWQSHADNGTNGASDRSVTSLEAHTMPPELPVPSAITFLLDYRGSISVLGTRRAYFFHHSPPVPAPPPPPSPNNLEYLLAVSKNLAHPWHPVYADGKGGGWKWWACHFVLLNAHISAYATCFARKVCGLVRSTWGTSQGEGKRGARVGYLIQR